MAMERVRRLALNGMDTNNALKPATEYLLGLVRTRATHFALTFLTVALSACCIQVSMIDVPPLAAATPRVYTIAAHRGVLQRGTRPDNSIAAIRQSIDAGVPFIEVDVRRSDEGDLFLFHDGSFHRDNSEAPSELRERPIQSLSRVEREGVYLDEAHTQTVPTLAQALDAVRGSRSTLQLDLKGESDLLTTSTLDLVLSKQQLSQVLVQIRSPERVGLVRMRYPSARILARCRSMEDLRSVLQHNVEFVELERWISSDAIALAHASHANVLVNLAGTRLDEPTTWEYFRTRGVDSITTDRADLFR
jgi:glycerophosphoryl diester phosphodiesterase